MVNWMNRTTYNVDDILEEVKRKRAREASMGGASGYSSQPPAPAQTPYSEYGGSYSQQAYPQQAASPPSAGRQNEWAAPAGHGYPQPEYPAQYEQPRREQEHYSSFPARQDPYAAPMPPASSSGYGSPGYMQPAPARHSGFGFAPENQAHPAQGQGYEQLGYARNRPQEPAGRYPAQEEPYPAFYGQEEPALQEYGAPAVPQAPAPPITVNRRTPKPSMDELLQNFGEGVGLGKGLDASRASIAPRRSAPIVGNTQNEPPQAAARGYSAAPAPRRFDYAPAPQPVRQPSAFGGRSSAGAYPGFQQPAVRGQQAGFSAPSYSPPPAAGKFQMDPPQGQGRFAPGGYQQSEYAAPETGYPADKPAGGRFDAGQFASPEPEPSPAPEPSFPAAEASALSSAWQAKPAGEMGFSEPPVPAPAPEPAFSEPAFPEPAPFSLPEEPEEPARGVLHEAEYTPPPFEQEATRQTEINDSLRSASVSHISLAPEDTQDDVDIDENGRTVDASSGESERQEILEEVRHTRVNLLVRLGVTAAVFAVLCFLAFAYMFPEVPTPPFMWAEGDTMRTFLIVNLLLVVTAMLVNYPVIGGGLVSLFTFKADNDSLLSLAMVAAVSQAVALIVTPDAADLTAGVHLYYCVPVLGLCFNLLGRLMTTQRIALGSRIVCGEGDKYVMRTIKSEDFSRQLSRGLPIDLPEITYSVKTRYVSGFLQAAYAQDYAESINRVLALICLGASAAVAAASYFISETRSLYLALTVFSALLCVCAPFTATIIGNAPMMRAARRLQKSGAVIAGYPVVEEYTEVKAATFKAKELFPEDSITLNSMKVFQESLIEQAILDAASVICATDSPLSPIFRGMINANEKILKPVDNIVYEDAMGLSAWVDGKRVLIGNAQLMANHGIATPSRDYERRYVGEGKQILYLSNSGELIAMFALCYEADGRVAAQMKELADGGVSLIIHSTDPNITPLRIAELYHYPQQYVKIVPANLHADYNRVIAPRGRARASIIYSGTIMSMFRALGIIPRIKSAVTAGTACQLLATLIGYAVITFFAFFAGMAHIPFTVLLVYQLVWAAAVAVVIGTRRI